MSEYLVKSEELTSIADAIRAKTGSSETMIFPDGFAEAVEGITAIGNSPEADMALTFWAERAAANERRYMFYGCTSLVTVPLFDISSSVNIIGMFNGCTSLVTVPLFNTSNVVNMTETFRNCASLTTVPLLDTSKVTSMISMFFNCESLTALPLFDMRNVTSTNSMCYYCHSLVTVPMLDMRKVDDMGSMLTSCNKLTECRLRNIKANLQVGSGRNWGHLLTVDSLVHLIYECRDTGSNKTLTIGSANMEKLANTYVKTIDITDEMRTEDDLIDEKLPFVVCDSTDEGAMLITSYVRLKNWTLA